jgi:F-type H+-transporting ATPase subunit epsilon
MATSFQLRIVTPRAQVLDEQVREVTAPGDLGEFGVLPDHIAFLTALQPGVLIYKTDRGAHKVAVRGGFAEVRENVMSVLADEAATPADVNAEAARAELQASEQRLQSPTLTEEERIAADDARRWAAARLETAR